MALGAAQILALETLLEHSGSAAALVPRLRAQFEGFSLTCCDPGDVGVEAPFRAGPGIALYLVDASSHCWQLTGDPAKATGFVVVGQKL